MSFTCSVQQLKFFPLPWYMYDVQQSFKFTTINMSPFPIKNFMEHFNAALRHLWSYAIFLLDFVFDSVFSLFVQLPEVSPPTLLELLSTPHTSTWPGTLPHLKTSMGSSGSTGSMSQKERQETYFNTPLILTQENLLWDLFIPTTPTIAL